MTKGAKTVLAVILTYVMLASVTACGEVPVEAISPNTTAAASDGTATAESSTGKSETQVLSLSGSLTLTGSTSMADVTTALAEAFMAANKDVIVSVGGNGSGEGPTAVNDGTAQIGMLSRDLKDTETPAAFDKYIIGYDGIAVIVNSASGVTGLTTDQITKIFKGEITNWKDVGGVDAKIQCIGREAASGTRGAFEELMKIKDAAVYAEEQNSTGNVKQAVSANPDAIGYVSISAIDNTIVAVKLDGIAPTEETVKSGDYLLQRPFLMITSNGTSDPLATAFLDYVFSDAGMKIVADDGIVPNPGKN
ncbi:MAG: phosphate ABC transporter substrate-binding protein [Eubacteriales bacterium]